jgi:AraC-like DNA-binding protein
MICIYPKLLNAKEYKSYALQTANLELVGVCENVQENTVELLLVYDALIVCFEGANRIFADGGKKFTLGKNEMLFVPKGSLVTATAIPSGGRHIGGVISLVPELLKEYNIKISESCSNLILSNNKARKIACKESLDFIKTFCPLLRINQDRANSLIKPKLLELLLILEINRCIDFLRVGSAINRSQLVTLPGDIDVSESITIEEMAKRMGLSLSTFKREFKKSFNEPAKQWLTKKKIEKAYFMLMTTTKSIKEIALECGFSDSSHFIKLFKRTYGHSPGSMVKPQISA